ncbi:hypothetical protein CLOLEP_03688 [[Clostridium] leptum DSM 753]|uniref:Uncharacterized protein n=1 Tax=[Clostridium] leptum DSM 753 TaxID=428125 RepID=A7VYL0_9FIRM|nr:hypothetical protein CLOLEP_03688 [[Clostridium] leptum DSM 753]
MFPAVRQELVSFAQNRREQISALERQSVCSQNRHRKSDERNTVRYKLTTGEWPAVAEAGAKGRISIYERDKRPYLQPRYDVKASARVDRRKRNRRQSQTLLLKPLLRAES